MAIPLTEPTSQGSQASQSSIDASSLKAAGHEIVGTGEDELDLANPPFPLTTTDRRLLAMSDVEFGEITWSDLRDIIDRNDLAALKRRPSDLRRYLLWSHRIKQSHGGIASYVLRERLHWTPSPPSPSSPGISVPFISPVPFSNPSDFAILRNDWPYGFSANIHHLLVWTKSPIEVDMSSGGDVTPASRKLIEDFVRKTFTSELEDGEQRVMWFKNWVALQSVRGVDHVHVLVKDVDEATIERWCRPPQVQP